MSDTADRPHFAEIPGNPAPKNLVGGYLETSDKRRLRYATARLPGQARGTVVLLQGRNEAIEKYFETIADLNARGFSVVTFDWRGQGGSERLLRSSRLGHVRHFGQFLVDLECIMQEVVLPDCHPPYNVLAHSMGGLIAIHASAQLTNTVERMVLLAPLVGFAATFPSLATARTAVGHRPLVRSRRPAGPPFHSGQDAQPCGQSPHLRCAPLSAQPAARRGCPGALSRQPDHRLAGGDDAGDAASGQLGRDRLAVRPDAGRDRGGGSGRFTRGVGAACLSHALRIEPDDPACARHEMLQEADRFRDEVLEVFDAYVGEETTLAAQ